MGAQRVGFAMKSKLLTRDGGRAHALIFETGDEVVAALREFAQREKIGAARFTAIGAFQSATLAFFDWETKKYQELPVEEQVEVLVLAGDLALKDDKPEPHIHVVLGRRDGSTRGGHLVRAIVRPTLELMLEEGGALKRVYDSATGLALIAP